MFLHCSLQGTGTTGHWAPEEKLCSLMAGEKLSTTTTTGFKSNTVEAKSQHKKQSCDSVAEWADNGYI